MDTRKRHKIIVLENLTSELVGTGDLCHFEDYAPHIQEVIIELIASIIENKKKQQRED